MSLNSNNDPTISTTEILSAANAAQRNSLTSLESLNSEQQYERQQQKVQPHQPQQQTRGAMPSSTLNSVQDSARHKRRGRKPKYPDPTPGYRSSYSVNRSFTQTEVIVLKHILKEAGEPPADLFATRVWPPSPQDSNHHQQSPLLMQRNNDHHHHHSHQEGDSSDAKVIDQQVTDATMVFPVNEHNPKNQELLSNARRKRSRNVTSPYQSRVLRKVLAVTSFPSTEMREALANALNMHPRTVQIWFQNQRQKAKNNPQASVNMNTGGLAHFDGYSPELVPMQMTPSGTNIYFHNLTMFPNSNVVQGGLNTQQMISPTADDHHRQTNNFVTQVQSTSDKEHGQLQMAQNYLPVATTYMSPAQFATPYTILPLFQPSTPVTASSSPQNPSAFSNPQYHPYHQSPQSAATSPTSLQYPVYPTPHNGTAQTFHQMSPTQQHSQQPRRQGLHHSPPQHQQHQLPYVGGNPNPTLDMLAAAASLQREDPSHQHSHPTHQHQPQRHGSLKDVYINDHHHHHHQNNQGSLIGPVGAVDSSVVSSSPVMGNMRAW